MALYKGSSKCRFCKGDLRPAALYLGDKQIAGAVPDTVSGDGRIEYTSPYKGPFKSVTVSGSAKQEQYEGYNMLDLSKATLANCKLQDDGIIVSNINNSYYCEILTTELNDYLLANAGKTITFTINDTTPGKYITIVIYGKRTTTEYAYQSIGAKNAKCLSITIANDFETISVLALRFNNNHGVKHTDTTTVFSSPMLLEGSYTAETLPEYEPYAGGKIVEPTNHFKEVMAIDGNYRIVANRAFYNNDSVTLIFDAVVSMDKTIKITYGAMTGFETVVFEGDVVGDGTEAQHIKTSFTMYIDGWESDSTICNSFDVYGANSKEDISNVKILWGSDTIEYSYQPRSAPNADYPIQPEFSTPQIASRSSNLWEPYFDGGSTQCPELYAMPDGSYRDTIDVQSGKVTRRVQKIVLDGATNKLTKNDASLNSYLYYIKLSNTAVMRKGICTHFQNVNVSYPNKPNTFSVFTVPDGRSILYIWAEGIVSGANATLNNSDEINAWLKQQYEAGTPVTLWYVLEEPVVETVDVVPLEMSGGYGQIIQTDWGLTAPIEVKYHKEYQD